MDFNLVKIPENSSFINIFILIKSLLVKTVNKSKTVQENSQVDVIK